MVFPTAMASAASPKRMVSSVFITLASPYRATVTQQQPTLQAHSSPARDNQHTAVRVSPNDSSIPTLTHKKEDPSPPETNRRKDQTHVDALARASGLQSPRAVRPGPHRAKQPEDKDNMGTCTFHDKIHLCICKVTSNKSVSLS